jgi:hypothetical protein
MGSFRRVSLFTFAALVFFSCRKSARWDVDIVLPVARASLNLKNFFSDSLFKSDASGLLYFNLKREIAALKLDSLVRLPDTIFNVQIPDSNFWKGTPIGLTLSHDPPPSIPSEDIVFNIPNGVQLTLVDIRSGTLSVDFSNDLSQPLDLEYLLPGISKDGIPFRIKETIPPGARSLHRDYDMSGYHFNLKGSKNNKYNQVAQSSTVMLNPDASTVYVQPYQGVKLLISYSHILPAYIEGNFGHQQVQIPADTTAFSLLENLRADNFMLSEVNMTFKLINEFGADFSADFTGIHSINSPDMRSVLLQCPSLSDIHLNAAVKKAGQLAPDTQTRFFNNANSNIAAFISNLPDKISYGGSAELNPVLQTSSNFAYYNTGIRILADINIPLRFTANKFTLQTKVPVDYSGSSQFDKVESGRIVVTASNRFPFEAILQIYLQDESGNTLDSLFEDMAHNRIRQAILDGNNDFSGVVSSELSIPLTRAKLEHLKVCRWMRINSVLLLPPNPPEIRIRESELLDIKIIAELKYNTGI